MPFFMVLEIIGFLKRLFEQISSRKYEKPVFSPRLLPSVCSFHSGFVHDFGNNRADSYAGQPF
jgi:hypothetical protein